MLTRNMLPEAHRSYFFKSLEYTIERIQVGARLYAWQSNSALNGAGNIFGYVTEDVQDGEKFTHTIWVTSANTSIANLTKTITTTARNNSKPTYMIRNVTMSQTNIQAGESVNIQGRIEGVSYPYGNSTWIKNISLGVVLPKDVSINEQAITAVTSTKISITTFTLEKRELETGNNLWIIRFPKDICIGYATEKLGVLEGGIYITFHLQLDTSYTMNNATLFAREMLFAAGYKQQNGAGGSYSWARATDTYDLNENNSTTDYIACMDARESTNCQIVSQTAMLDVTDSISITNNANTTPESHQGAIPSPEAIIQYHLDISCSSGGHVEGFEYYIPVPKMTSGIDTFLIEEIGFDTSLIEMPQITGSDVLSVVYTFEPGLTYTSVKDVTTWYTAEEIENTETLQWEDVTMLQLTMKNGVMENGDKTRVTLQTKYTGTQFPEEAGMQNVWHSGGFYVHINGDRETAGNYATIGASVMLHYAIENPDIILTAAKNGVPQVEGNVAEQTIGENFPMFIHAHNFSVVEIETYNVTLQTKAYMQSNVEMSGNEANRTFAITAGIAEKEVDIVEDNKTNSIGTSTAGASPIIRFAIYNGNQLSDNAVSRYIVVTLQSDKGVTVKQKIIINRELERATDPKSAIVSGKRYMTFDDTSTEVTISKDSAFTAQFITSYIPNNYGEHSLQFSQILPADTTIVLANVTDENNPMYYYYVADGTTKEIHFTQCVQMGTIQTKNYAYYTGEESVEEKILVIVDFANVASEHLEVGDYTLQIAIKGNGVENYTSKILGFSTTEKRAFSLESEETITAGETSSIQYTMTQQVGVESKYEGRKLALILIPPENIPEDTSVTANGQMYYLNIHRQYIIPLGEVQAVNGNIDVIVQSAAWPQSGADYMWNMELWVAATANAHQPMMGEKVANKTVAVSVKRMLQPALKIMDSDTRILHQQDTQKEILLTYQYIQDAECTVTIELMQKVGSGYQRITDKLNQVAGNTTHHMGVFDIPSTTGKQQIRLKFASAMELGTYRLQLKVYDNNKEQLLSIPYNFMVVL